MIKPCNFSICDTTNWVWNTDSPIHICNRCRDYKSAEGSRMGVVFDRRDENRVPILTIGVLSLVFDSSTVELIDCHYCPSYIMSIISVGLLASYGYELLDKEMFVRLL